MKLGEIVIFLRDKIIKNIDNILLDAKNPEQMGESLKYFTEFRYGNTEFKSSSHPFFLYLDYKSNLSLNECFHNKIINDHYKDMNIDTSSLTPEFIIEFLDETMDRNVSSIFICFYKIDQEYIFMIFNEINRIFVPIFETKGTLENIISDLNDDNLLEISLRSNKINLHNSKSISSFLFSE